VTVDAPDLPASVDETHASGGALFGYDARKEGRLVARIRGFASEGQRVSVAAEVHPLTSRADLPPERSHSEFPSQEHALRFVSEALIALEYLDCAVAALDVDDDTLSMADGMP
jgi:hypothetical protein